MHQGVIYILVRWLNPIIGGWIGKKTGKQFSEAQINQILSEQYPKSWEITYGLIIAGYLIIFIGTLFGALVILSRWYAIYHHLLPNTPQPGFLNFATIMLLFFFFLFWVGLFYFGTMMKLVSRKFYNYMLMQQVKGGYPMSLEDATALILKLSIVISLIALPIIAYFFLK